MTTKLEQAARQALEALEQNTYYNFDDDIKVLREALAEQAEQEPVAWMDENGWASIYKDELYTRPLYTAPVRTKDLTDDEIFAFDNKAEIDPLAFARSVIAADREKNK